MVPPVPGVTARLATEPLPCVDMGATLKRSLWPGWKASVSDWASLGKRLKNIRAPGEQTTRTGGAE